MKKYKLGELCLTGKIGIYGIPATAEDFSEGKVRYLRISDINDDGTINNTDKKSVSDAHIDNYILVENDIVFARTGNSTGRSYLYDSKDGKLAFAGFLIKFGIDSNKVNPKYLRYFTTSNYYKQWVKNLSSGSTRGNISAQTFADCEIIMPARKQQNLLATVLSTLDEKITLNKSINQNLEAMAKQLYDYWFVQFDFPNEKGKPYKSSGGKMVWNEKLKREIPEGWKVTTLGQLCNLKNGINYSKDEVGKIYKIVNVRNISSSRILLDGEIFDEITIPEAKAQNYILTNKDIIIARSGCPGSTRLLMSPDKKILFCGFIICCTPKDLLYRNFLTFTLKQIEGTSATTTGGSILQNVSQDTLKRLLIVNPSNQLLEIFDNNINTIFSKLLISIKEISELTKQRDELLPLLMNGQVSVNGD